MPIAAAIVGSVVAGGIGYAASRSASKTAANASQEATDANVALQREILGLQQANTATSRAVGNAALMQLAQRFGLPVEQVAATASSMGVPVEGGGASAATQSSPTAPKPKVDQAFLDNPFNADLVAEGNRVVQAGEFPDMASYLAWHDQQNPGEAKDRGNWQAPAQTTSASDIDQNGYYTGARPTVGAAPTYVAPTYRETAVAPLDVSLEKYQQSPDFNFQQEQGNRNILATASATGGLESGAALKALQKFGQDLAMGDYSQWRSYTSGRYDSDRAYTANRDDAANSFNQSTALAKYGADESAYQYGTNLAQSIFNSNRDYATNRFDTNTNALMGLAGYGQQATSGTAGALQAYGSNVGNAYFTNASNQGNAALAGAGQVNNLLSNGSSALAYYYANQRPGAGTPSANSALGPYAGIY